MGGNQLTIIWDVYKNDNIPCLIVPLQYTENHKFTREKTHCDEKKSKKDWLDIAHR